MRSRLAAISLGYKQPKTRPSVWYKKAGPIRYKNSLTSPGLKTRLGQGEPSFSLTVKTNGRPASQLAQHDENLMLDAIISKRNICTTNEHLAVYVRGSNAAAAAEGIFYCDLVGG